MSRSELSRHAGDLPLVVVLVGPTAVGKTEVSLQLAKKFSSEIVSADSRLFYRGMDIGTAKPSPEERAQVPHHLVDIADPDETLSLVEFQQRTRDAISSIVSRGRLPLLVGGTGQYIRAVTAGWKPPQATSNPTLRTALERLISERGKAWLHRRLEMLDPAAASSIDLRNARRTIRALEVILTTGRRFSEQRRAEPSPFHFTTIGLRLPRSELYSRIDQRIDKMFESGLLDETRRLLQQGYAADLPAFSAIGYAQCLRVIRGEWDVEQAKADTRRATRVFARRQANWFKDSDPRIAWFDASKPELAERIGSMLLRSNSAAPSQDPSRTGTA